MLFKNHKPPIFVYFKVTPKPRGDFVGRREGDVCDEGLQSDCSFSLFNQIIGVSDYERLVFHTFSGVLFLLSTHAFEHSAVPKRKPRWGWGFGVLTGLGSRAEPPGAPTPTVPVLHIAL